jgi:hypothetical protein
MEISSIEHINPDELADINANLFICTLSHESRSTHIAKLLEGLNCRKIALAPAGQENLNSFRENQEYLREKDFEIIYVDSEVPDLKEILRGITERHMAIILDCTSMSQNWYYEFFRWFDESQEDFDHVRLRFVYTTAGYVQDDSGNKVRRVKEFLKREIKKKNSKKALILGLGHEPKVAEAICKIEKPDLLYLFYADPPVDKRFVEKLFVNNHKIIQETPIRNLIAYPINNGQQIYQSLIDVLLPLRNDYSITLIPRGPKIFSVAAMLVHLGYPDTRICYPVFKRPVVQNREASGSPVVLDVFFEGEE